jgi:hypothetical protein
MVTLPAIFLILLGLATVVIGMAACTVRLEARDVSHPNNPYATPEQSESFEVSQSLLGAWMITWGTIVVVGGINMLAMRIHMVAVAASIVIMVPCLVGPSSLPGLFVGCWALSRLYDPVVRSSFWG